MVDLAKSIVVDFWATVAEMSPYLLFGFFVAGLLSVIVSQRFVERHLGGRGLWPLLKASVFGVPLPLCSCGVIPVSMSLHKHGASKGSTIAFLLSTPQTGVDSIFVTLSLLGPVFAIFRPVAALVTGLVGGTLVDVFGQAGEVENSPAEKCADECCSGEKSNRVVRGLKYGFVTLPRDIGKAMLVGLVVAAFISALVPDGYFAEKLGTGILPLVAMMLLGTPVYVCATASVPVAAALIVDHERFNTRCGSGLSDDRTGNECGVICDDLESLGQDHSDYLSGDRCRLCPVERRAARSYCCRHRFRSSCASRLDAAGRLQIRISSSTAGSIGLCTLR
jgi:uncharacterized membrane protein YraQ (UPF0718 family)